MERTSSNGLSGKARRARTRNRAARMQARRMVSEYLEPAEVETGMGRYIPIRGRDEFLPSVVFARSTVAKRSRDAKPLDQGTGVATGVQVMHEQEGFCAVPPRASSLERTEPIRFSGLADAGRDVFDARRQLFGRPKKFRVGGFLFGCALGTMAASILLFGLHTVIR